MKSFCCRCGRVDTIIARAGLAGHWSMTTAQCHRATVYAPLCENMTSSTKPEVHNALQCRQRRTKLRPRVTCRENSATFGHVVFEISLPSGQTDRQTYATLIVIFRIFMSRVISAPIDPELCREIGRVRITDGATPRVAWWLIYRSRGLNSRPVRFHVT